MHHTEPNHPAVTEYDQRIDFEHDNYDPVEYITAKAIHFHNNPVPAPTGFRLVDCTATPRHPAIYEMIDNDFYGMPCHYCVGAAEREQYRKLERETHWARHWVRWRWFKHIDRVLDLMGIDVLYTLTMSHTCRGCCTGITFRVRRREGR